MNYFSKCWLVIQEISIHITNLHFKVNGLTQAVTFEKLLFVQSGLSFTQTCPGKIFGILRFSFNTCVPRSAGWYFVYCRFSCCVMGVCQAVVVEQDDKIACQNAPNKGERFLIKGMWYRNMIDAHVNM